MMQLDRTLFLLAVLTLFGGQAAAQTTRPPGARYASTQDDAEFMQGMIAHHAQALVMARQAESSGESQAVKTLAARITLGQRTEIGLMQDWLRARGYPTPDSTGTMPADTTHAAHATHDMRASAGPGGHRHPGMLTDEQLALLAGARGASWDRLFLVFMIQHHQGAVAMVDRLFASPAGGQDDDIFKFASGVHADQSTEIERMKELLEAVRRGGPPLL